jgi:type I restriction enzyme S subunit
MAGRYKAYPEYQDSGVKWLGRLPSHWEAKRLGQFFSERREKVSDKDYSALSVTMQGIVPQLDTAAKTDAGDNRKLVLKNDFVINSRSDRKGSSGVSPYDGSVSLISIVLEPRNIEEFYRFGKGIVADLWSTNSSEMKNIQIPCIPPSEQKQIARFLDHETGKIDALIEKQQTLIALLKEKRQAVISHAVTKGLNPEARMKDSGVEWLGDVPEHWEVKKVKNLACLISKGTTPSTIGGDFVDQGIRFLKAENVGKSLHIEPKPYFYITKQVDALISRSRLKEHDVLVIIAGATTGLASIVTSDLLPANTNQAVSFIRPKKPAYSKFIVRWLSTEFAQRTIWIDAVQAAQPNLSMEDLGNISISLPPIDELENIMKAVDDRLDTFEGLIAKAEGAIGLMQERRTALISAAVTGKIDVRDWEPALEAQGSVT